ncbi:hypothetical protein BX667DRAFT_481632 [Coemansia mojavensis]|nr:hypothetical protein BX667DRAFT_481632 [Coemansia mojavensis]
MNIAQPVNSRINGVSFTFCEPEEVRKMSVKQVVNPVLLDSLGNPTTGGLYDPAMGPFTRNHLCGTCSLSYFDCPGHFGHIELPAPVVNPMMFDTLLLEYGLIQEANDLDNLLPRTAKSQDEEDELFLEEEEEDTFQKSKKGDETEEEYIERVKNYVDECLSQSLRSTYKVTMVNQVRRLLIKELISRSRNMTCQNCRGPMPRLRRDGYLKVFREPLSNKQRAAQQAKGLTFRDVMELDSSVFMTPLHLRNHLRLLFNNEAELIRLLFQQRDPQMASAVEALNMFFIEALPVPPTKFRPASVMNDEVMENPQNVYLGAILKTCVHMRDIAAPVNGESSQQSVLEATQSGVNYENVINTWVRLQQAVNNAMDSSKNPTLGKNGRAPDPGIRQILEKKEGLFRQNMMGKRVNYAARSVISPDPNLESDEVGVPPVFARKLTFPEPVTPYNVKEMRQLVINGPETWPGAESVQNEDGSLVYLRQLSHESRVALANQLLTPQESVAGVRGLGNMFTTRATMVNKKVYRHLRNGDMVVMNRQPTLHRASMAGMRARVLPGERTLRFHYLNCNQFNSDFDGDEMNMHFPQSESARSELRNIMDADNTYLNPTDGGPLRGLIQDSVDGGVILTNRDTFLTRSEYQELVYWALRPETQPQLPQGKIQLMPPAIFKPRPLWTGKQVISTLLLNLTWGCAPLNLVSKNKVSHKYWGSSAQEEERVLFLNGELLVGILDKSQFGASRYGLVHSVYELYSPTHAGRLLSGLGRLFLRYLQEIGFSCRMEDLLFDKQGDSIRKELIKEQQPKGVNAALGFVGLTDYDADKLESDSRVKKEFQTRMEEVLRHDNKLQQLDGTISGVMGGITSDVIAQCLPGHLQLPFPHNNMVVMTVSGAKGSNVNLSQITCCLGQQTLEGRRVPLMVSGKSLPSFVPFDSSGRAGGYVASRFLTGLKPQEFYFHCMAGREGLIDTAVKTSRSGYLQRCLIKHLEGIQVHYDYTVRDADGSVIQFQYGEDALDVLKSQHLMQFDFAAANYRALRDKFDPASVADILDYESARKYAKQILGKNEEYSPAAIEGEPLSSRFNPSRYLGAVSEKFYVELEKYLKANPSGLLYKKKKHGKAESDCSARNFRLLQYLNYSRSLIDPGESVGLIAAQGIGEPSTQMTLNTFHLAGFGAKNVTLGIPRLREIVMVASDHIAAPVMDIPMAQGVTKRQAENISSKLTKLTLGDVIDYVEVKERLTAKKNSTDHRRFRHFNIRLQLFPSQEIYEEHGTRCDDIEFAIEHHFANILEALVAKDLKRTYRSLMSEDIAAHDEADDGEENSSMVVDDSDAESEEDMEEEDADDARTAQRRADKASYDGPDDEDKEVMDTIDAELDELNEMAEDSSESGESEDEEEREQAMAISVAKRKNRMVVRYPHVIGYNFVDNDQETYAEIEMQFSATTPKFLMLNLAEQAVRETVIQELKGIVEAFVNKPQFENDVDLVIGTAGSNIHEIWRASLYPLDWVDINRLYTNDIAAILRTYGVEAARMAIMREIGNVFDAYKISVDKRHLSLVADYMTFEGGFKPFNRIGLSSSPSPFAKMSFESTCTFLQEAAVYGDIDDLRNPSARIVVGQPVKSGTGSFDVLLDLPKQIPVTS